MPQMHTARRDRAAAAAVSLGADAVLITSGVNVRYLTGLVSSNAALLLPVQGPAVLGTDSRYAGTAERECEDIELVIEREVESALVRRALADGLRTIAFEDQAMTVRSYREVSGGEPGVGSQPRAQLVPLGRATEELPIGEDEGQVSLVPQ